MNVKVVVNVLLYLCLPLREVIAVEETPTCVVAKPPLGSVRPCVKPPSIFPSFIQDTVSDHATYEPRNDMDCCRVQDGSCCSENGICKCSSEVTCGKCELGWTYIGLTAPKCFKLFIEDDDKAIYTDVSTKCGSATIADFAVHDVHTEIMKEFRSKIGDGKIWIGLTSDGNDWLWESDGDLTYTRWSIAQPVGVPDESVFEGATCDSTWEVSGDAADKHGFICEKLYE